MNLNAFYTTVVSIIISLDAVTKSSTEMQKLFNCNVYSGFFLEM